MPDYAMCDNKDCVLSPSCRRHADSGTKPRKTYQPYHTFSIDEKTIECAGFWSIKK